MRNTILFLLVLSASAVMCSPIAHLQKRDSASIVYPIDRSVISQNFNVTVQVKTDDIIMTFLNANITITETDSSAIMYGPMSTSMGSNVFDVYLPYGSYMVNLYQSYVSHNATTNTDIAITWVDNVIFTVSTQNKIDQYNEMVKNRTIPLPTPVSSNPKTSAARDISPDYKLIAFICTFMLIFMTVF